MVWGGWKGYIHPLAFRSSKWDMEYCRDGFIRPYVCDNSVEHQAYEPYDKYEKVPIIPPWNGQEWNTPGRLN